MSTRLIALLCTTALIYGCATRDDNAMQLEMNQSYKVEWIGDRPLIDRSHLTITFGSDEGRAYGSAGCNNWFASFTHHGAKLSFGPIGSTRKACAPSLMEQEQRFLETLSRTERWDISEQGQLQLWPRTGAPIRLWLEDKNQNLSKQKI